MRMRTWSIIAVCGLVAGWSMGCSPSAVCSVRVAGTLAGEPGPHGVSSAAPVKVACQPPLQIPSGRGISEELAHGPVRERTGA